MENKNTDILNDINTNNLKQENNQEIFFENIEEIQIDNEIKIEKQENKNTLLSPIIFLFKYILTSGFIFWILLISTNYSAYLNITKSYIFKEKQEIEAKWIINSVEASNIQKKYETKLNNQKQKNIEETKEKVSKYSLKKLISEANKQEVNYDIEITPYDNRIVIPKIGKNIPLLDLKNKKLDWWTKELNDIFMKELEGWVIRYPWSSKPWQNWTTFIFWHSSNFPWMKWDYNDVFALLDNVEFWDEIYIYYWQKKYKYKIKEKNIITPWDVWVLNRNKNKSELTIMTCWPIWTTLNRLIVTWELIEK